MKFFQFFLSLCFLLLSGCIYPNPHVHHERTWRNVCVRVQHPSLALHSTPSRREKDHRKTHSSVGETAEENDDDEQSSFRKLLKLTTTFTSFLRSRSASFFSYKRQGLSFNKHFSYPSSSSYIVFRVIRI